MKIRKSETADGKIELNVIAPASKVQEAIQFINIQMAIQNDISLQEINDPSSLESAVKDKVGEAYYDSFINFQVTNFLAPFAITKEKVSIIGPPKVTTVGARVIPNRDLVFDIEAVKKPIYEIDDFSPVEITVPALSISEKDVDVQIEMMAESRATYAEQKNASVEANSDVLFSIKTIDDEGNEVKNMTAEQRSYKLGEDYMPDEFEDHLIGMKAGQTKTFTVTSPYFNLIKEEVDEDAEPATFTFTITIVEVQKKIIPTIDDAWVKENVQPLQTVAELREEILQQGLTAQAKEIENTKSYLAATEFSKRLQASFSDELYELMRDDILLNMQQQLQSQGRTLQEYIEEQGGGDQQFSMQLMVQAREVLLQGFSLDALARHLKLTINDQDIAKAFSLMAPGHEFEARSEFEMTGRMYLIEEAALRNKANEWLVENAIIKELEQGQKNEQELGQVREEEAK